MSPPTQVGENYGNTPRFWCVDVVPGRVEGDGSESVEEWIEQENQNKIQ